MADAVAATVWKKIPAANALVPNDIAAAKAIVKVLSLRMTLFSLLETGTALEVRFGYCPPQRARRLSPRPEGHCKRFSGGKSRLFREAPRGPAGSGATP